MGQLVEVLAIEIDDVAADGPLLGANLDEPAPGRRIAAAALEIGGWALAREGAVAVEVTHGAEVLAATPVRHAREDIAAAFPTIEGSAQAGFQLVVDATATPVESELEVRARLGEELLPIGRLRLRKLWRGAVTGAAPLITVVVLAGEDDEALETNLKSVGRQRHEPTEVLVAHPAPASPPLNAPWRAQGVRALAGAEDPATLRNEAIRGSGGELLCFLPGDVLLAEGALARAAEALRGQPAAAALIDGSPGAVAASLYRRSAFEELGGFAAGTADCEVELVERAAGFDLLFEPGSLVAGGG